MAVDEECKWNKSKPSQLARGHATFQTAVSENVNIIPLAEQLCSCFTPLEMFLPSLLICRQNISRNCPWGHILPQPAYTTLTAKVKTWFTSLYNSKVHCTLKTAAHREVLLSSGLNKWKRNSVKLNDCENREPITSS